MAWIYLGLAIVFEVIGTVTLKLSQGWVYVGYGLISLASYLTCFVALGFALKVLPVGVSYAIWSGIGIVAAVCLGLLLFGETLTPFKTLCFAMILAGSIGLTLVTESV